MTKTTDTPEDRAPETGTTDKPNLGFGCDLAPCPFCGGRARQYMHGFGGGQQCGTHPLGIECKTCQTVFFLDWHSSVVKLIRRWNERPMEETLRNVIGEAEEQRDRWYAAAGQRQDDLNGAYKALAWVCQNLPFETGEKIPEHLRPKGTGDIITKHIGRAKAQFKDWWK